MSRKSVILSVCSVLVSFLACGFLSAQEKKAPAKPIVFETKQGKVSFSHTAHEKSVKGGCAACHDKLFPQDAKAPLNFKAGVHKPAEQKGTSCGACHKPGGTSFETKGNCAKCHVKGEAKKG